MAPWKAGKVEKAKPQKKEKIFHPQSRKAAQMNRANVRKDKMAGAASKRVQKQSARTDLYIFFYHAIPPEGDAISLENVHGLVTDVWLSRHDADLASEQAQRRKGRPKSAKEMKLEELKLREAEEYRTGLEVIDLTHFANVKLFRQWDQTEVAYIDLLRFIRISSERPEVAVVSRPGKHLTLKPPKIIEGPTAEAMDVSESV